ncbi:response regulator transcription factor [Microbispora cellulosiformans]|uniref:Response regulator transcription factor n=1 Tax=Microbispora cellulosiformans TaxID=2614688 RepID=A0A5J5KBN1_9ACTN|nr:response regulator transcription factor [Microbispora cellulosiformans]KAA9381379.1 response regulator transcription factor [Microbispora cellulosiformans]
MRIVIAEDAVLLRDGLTRLLSDKHHEVVAGVADADALLAAIAEHRPDLAVVDIRMPPTFTDEGLRAAFAIRSGHPGVAVLLLSQYVVDRYAVDLLGGDIRGIGYLLKDRVADVGDFLRAVDEVGAGGTVIDPEVVRQLLNRGRRDPHLHALTERERQVLTAMAEGRSNASIARTLHISEGSVEKHVASIFPKLGLHADRDTHRRVLAVIAYLRDTAG